MIGRYRASLGGVQMDSLVENMLILDVQYSPLKYSRQMSEYANQDGFTVSHEGLPQRTVTIVFELHIYDIAKRNAACQKINEWAAAGGELRINDREGQYLQVGCDQYAEIQSAKEWTRPLALTFCTRENPYWMSDEQKTVTLAGKTAKSTILMDGNVSDAKVSVTATAQAAVTSFLAVVGDTQIKLTGLSVANGQKIVIDYLEGKYLRIRANGKDVMAKMVPADSSDLLLAPCGKRTQISFTASAKMSVAFSARGVWR